MFGLGEGLLAGLRLIGLPVAVAAGFLGWLESQTNQNEFPLRPVMDASVRIDQSPPSGIPSAWIALLAHGYVNSTLAYVPVQTTGTIMLGRKEERRWTGSIGLRNAEVQLETLAMDPGYPPQALLSLWAEEMPEEMNGNRGSKAVLVADGETRHAEWTSTSHPGHLALSWSLRPLPFGGGLVLEYELVWQPRGNPGRPVQSA